MASLAALFNSEITIEFEGKSYRMRQPNQIEMGEYEKILEQGAYDAIERRVYQDPEQQDRDRNLLNRDIAAGVYRYNGELATKSLRDPHNLGTMFAIVLREQGVSHELGRRIVSHHHKLIAFHLMSRTTQDPKEVALVLAVLGLPKDHLTPSATSSSHSATPHSDTNSGTSEASPTTSLSTSSMSNEAPVESQS